MRRSFEEDVVLYWTILLLPLDNFIRQITVRKQNPED